jgi:hypothetical protein
MVCLPAGVVNGKGNLRVCAYPFRYGHEKMALKAIFDIYRENE